MLDDRLQNIWDGQYGREMDIDQLSGSFSRVLARIDRPRRLWRAAAIAAAVAVPSALAIFIAKPSAPAQKEIIFADCFVPDGTIKTISFDDGSSAILNAGSTLIYPESFAGTQRTVYLSGEASFSVAKDEGHPFIVKTTEFDVRVTGTVFNVHAYPGEKSGAVSVAEGRVIVNCDGSGTPVEPNQKAVISDGGITLTLTRPEDDLGWSRGEVVLRNASINDISSIIRRAYGMEVILGNRSKYSNVNITAHFNAGAPVEDMLNVLSKLIPSMKYTVDEDRSICLY